VDGLSTGSVVRQHRERLGFSQSELGSRVGRTKQWVSELERGNINISYEMARALASVFGQTPDALFLPAESTVDRLPTEVAGT
jgi:putative transcriptional regulator